MPLTPSQVAATIKSTIGHYGKQGGQINAVKVRDAIANRLGVTGGPELNAMLAHVTSAKRMLEAGAVLDSQSDLAAPLQAHPLDRSLDPAHGKYGYRVLIHVTDSDTLTSYSALEIVYSNSPMTRGEATAAAFQQWERNRYDIGTDPKRNDTGANVNISGEILTVGRAP